MVADPVAFGVRAHRESAILDELPAEHEERRLEVMAAQSIENARRHVGLGPIVE
jgi:hypothetical protein